MKKVKYSTRYIKSKEKLIKNSSLSEDSIYEAIDIFLKDRSNKRVRFHKINCKRDKNRASISIPNTQYRILFSNEDILIFWCICNHNIYDRMNKDC